MVTTDGRGTERFAVAKVGSSIECIIVLRKQWKNFCPHGANRDQSRKSNQDSCQPLVAQLHSYFVLPRKIAMEPRRLAQRVDGISISTDCSCVTLNELSLYKNVYDD